MNEVSTIRVITQTGRCMDEIESLLENGTNNTADIYKHLALLGFSKGTIWRAATKLGVVSTLDSKWRPSATWELPS